MLQWICFSWAEQMWCHIFSFRGWLRWTFLSRQCVLLLFFWKNLGVEVALYIVVIICFFFLIYDERLFLSFVMFSTLYVRLSGRVFSLKITTPNEFYPQECKYLMHVPGINVHQVKLVSKFICWMGVNCEVYGNSLNSIR